MLPALREGFETVKNSPAMWRKLSVCVLLVEVPTRNPPLFSAALPPAVNAAKLRRNRAPWKRRSQACRNVHTFSAFSGAPPFFSRGCALSGDLSDRGKDAG